MFKTPKKMTPTGGNSVMSSQNLSTLAKSLLTLANLQEVKLKVRHLWKNGQLDKLQAAQLIRKWRSRQWQQQHKNKEALVKNLSEELDSTEEQTLDDVKQLVNRYISSGRITAKDGAFLIKKWKKRESRRIKRHLESSQSCCFYCRQTGHKFSECPEKDDRVMGSGICFKCGSTEHTSSKCLRQNIRGISWDNLRFFVDLDFGFPYAVCFVCKQQGHLSRDCDKNANGIYPDGGSCNLCGSQKHLKKDCPSKRVDKQTDPLIGVAHYATYGGDDDVGCTGSDVVEDHPKKKFERKRVCI
ncbi:unnamed protein product [Thelazia callipaeda]|uniref:CCHC-type domain-containing protein n=1 Tax=Thelazia callipaeda TaxID=103827 RepID=A0A0N5CWI7_THECL|nr:unnamed protein product [Thelazia callipaeda]